MEPGVPRKRKANRPIQIIKCTDPSIPDDVTLSRSSSNVERRYECNGHPIHRVTYWRHRKHGCPHFSQSKRNKTEKKAVFRQSEDCSPPRSAFTGTTPLKLRTKNKIQEPLEIKVPVPLYVLSVPSYLTPEAMGGGNAMFMSHKVSVPRDMVHHTQEQLRLRQLERQDALLTAAAAMAHSEEGQPME